jgi:hypothetical protein
MHNHIHFQPYAEHFAEIDPALDYSPGSLAVVENLLACLRQGLEEGQVSLDQLHWMVVGAGTYFAEILGRQSGVQWSHAEGQEPWLDTLAGRLHPFQLARDALSGTRPGAFSDAALRCGLADHCQRKDEP